MSYYFCSVPAEPGNSVFHDFEIFELTIGNEMYQISSVIVHHGKTIKNGHYTNLIDNIINWIKIDNCSVTKERSRTTITNPYLIIMEKTVPQWWIQGKCLLIQLLLRTLHILKVKVKTRCSSERLAFLAINNIN